MMRLTNYSHVLSEGEEFGDNWDCGAQDQNGKKLEQKRFLWAEIENLVWIY